MSTKAVTRGRCIREGCPAKARHGLACSQHWRLWRQIAADAAARPPTPPDPAWLAALAAELEHPRETT